MGPGCGARCSLMARSFSRTKATFNALLRNDATRACAAGSAAGAFGMEGRVALRERYKALPYRHPTLSTMRSSIDTRWRLRWRGMSGSACTNLGESLNRVKASRSNRVSAAGNGRAFSCNYKSGAEAPVLAPLQTKKHLSICTKEVIHEKVVDQGKMDHSPGDGPPRRTPCCMPGGSSQTTGTGPRGRSTPPLQDLCPGVVLFQTPSPPPGPCSTAPT